MAKKSEIALVVQGGSLRSIFSTGILDSFQAMNFNPFTHYIGVSGGAMTLSYFLSGQFRTAYHVIKELSEDHKFINIFNLFSEEGFVNLEYLIKYTQTKYPLQIEEALKALKNKVYEVVATNLEDGSPVYLNPDKTNWLKSLRASATLPFFTRGVCEVNGMKLMDGGWSDPIPVRRAIEMGAKKIVVIRTLPKDHKENWTYFGKFGGFWFRDKEGLSKRFSEDHVYYNEVVDFLNQEHEDVEIYQLAPEKYLKTTSYSATADDIDRDYRLGMDMGISFVKQFGDWF